MELFWWNRWLPYILYWAILYCSVTLQYHCMLYCYVVYCMHSIVVWLHWSTIIQDKFSFEIQRYILSYLTSLERTRQYVSTPEENGMSSIVRPNRIAALPPVSPGDKYLIQIICLFLSLPATLALSIRGNAFTHKNSISSRVYFLYEEC